MTSKHQTQSLNLNLSLSIGNDLIQPSPTAIRNLGVLMDSNLSMDSAISQICKSCYIHIHNLNRVKKYLDYRSLEKLIHCFITSKLDYCNALFLGLPAIHLNRLQRIQNVAARILTCTERHEHISPILFQLHWLPVESRVKFKILLLIHKALNENAPAYLCAMFNTNETARPLRSSSTHTLSVPFTRSSFMQKRSFTVAGSRLWNDLPSFLRHEKNTVAFKKHLKTILFNEVYHHFLHV